MTRPDQVQTLLGEWIEKVRVARGHTLEDVAQVTGLTELTLMRMGREMKVRRPWGRTLAVLSDYLRVDEAMVIALGQTQSTCSYVLDMRGQQHRVRDRRSKFSQLLDKVRLARGQTLEQVAAELLICVVTLSKAREIVPSILLSTWQRLADYVDRSVEQCQELAASPALWGQQTYPVFTWNGAKWHPSVPAVPCGQCPFCEPCMWDVLVDDFAWCEAVIAEDFQPG